MKALMFLLKIINKKLTYYLLNASIFPIRIAPGIYMDFIDALVKPSFPMNV